MMACTWKSMSFSDSNAPMLFELTFFPDSIVNQLVNITECNKAVQDFSKSAEQYRKSTALEKRSSKMAVKHKHNPKFKSFWSKQKSNRYA